VPRIASGEVKKCINGYVGHHHFDTVEGGVEAIEGAAIRQFVEFLLFLLRGLTIA
jgi:hypothetical protein